MSAVFRHQKLYLTLPWPLWDAHPFLLYGLIWFCGMLFVLCSPWALFPFLCLALTAYKRLALLTLLFLLPLPLLHSRYPPQDSQQGRFHITHFYHHYVWVYHGKFNGAPATFTSPDYHPPHHDYWVQGKWQTQERLQAQQWTALPRTYSLTIWQHDLRKQFAQRFQHAEVPTFLYGMLTDYCDSKVLKKRLQKLGLTPLFTLSTCYAVVLGSLIAKALYMVMHRSHVLLTLSFLSTCWYVITAPSSPLMWIGTMIVLWTLWRKKNMSWQDLLGITLFAGLSVDPYSCMNPTVHYPLLILLGSSPWICSWKTCSKQCFSVLTGILLIILCTLPYVLYHEHVFYLHSLLYLAVIPLLASLALVLLPFTAVCDAYLHLLLKLMACPPVIGLGYYVEQMTDAQLCITLTTLMLIVLGHQQACLVADQRTNLCF